MRFAICEMTGRMTLFEGATETTTVGDVRAFAAPVIRVPSPARVQLVIAGQQLKDDSVTLVSLGLTPEVERSFRIYALVKFQAPSWLFDGKPHPFTLNGVPLGGDLLPPKESYSFSSFVEALAALPEPKSFDDCGAEKEETASGKGDEKECEEPTTVAGATRREGISVSGIEDASVIAELEKIEKTNSVVIPSCVKALVSRAALREACSRRLAFNPFIVSRFVSERDTFSGEDEVAIAEEKMMFDCPAFVRPAEDKAGIIFMGDHQGCCYWYAVWDPTAVSSSCDKAAADSVDPSVYVIFGGQEFDLSASVFLTGASFWRFMVEYAEVSKN